MSSYRLCAALAATAYCLRNEDLTGEDLSAFTAARLIPLDPGVRPIAVGEVCQRIIRKSVMQVVERDVMCATAPLQMCVGIPSVCEAVVHAMDRLSVLQINKAFVSLMLQMLLTHLTKQQHFITSLAAAQQSLRYSPTLTPSLSAYLKLVVVKSYLRKALVREIP